ncbi:MAG: tRNA (adenosine(37)-N6)-threonylcarbamoyltransferase complex dimerization subunit type 1 TsaB [Candidatus Acidiferrales bacterium]
MLILALDTASPSGSIAVLRGEKVIGAVATDTTETYSSRMFRQLEFLLAELQLARDAFDLFAVNAGPGSFTGLRVGLTSAKGWAEVYGKPVVPVSGLQAIADQSRAEGLIIPLLDARRGEVYFGFYERSAEGLRRREDDRVGTPDEFLSAIAAQKNLHVASPDFTALGTLQERLRDRGASSETVCSILAPVVGRLAYRAAQRGQAADALTLDANYVRRSDAELHWKGHA